MEATYKLGSLFDGSGGFPLSGALCGINPVWAAEIEPYPIAVTTGRFPNMKHLGDIGKINGAEIEPVDIITFGSPCQDLSVAGKRAGLKHTENGDDETTRSGLFMEAVRIIKEMREATNGKYPRWALWENVPGAFSSNKGEDFRVVLEELIKIVEPGAVMPAVPQKGWPYADSYCGDGWSVAYRVFDAQYWGVPQRRRRIYLVADFRGKCAGKVLFEREGLRGYFAESGTPWQGTAADAERGVGADDRAREDYSGVGGRGLGAVGCDLYNGAITGDIAATLSAFSCATNSRNGPYALEISSGADDREGNGLIAVATQQGGAEISENGICPTITAAAGMSGNNQPWICAPETGGDTCEATAYAIDQQGGKGGANFAKNVMPTLCSDSHGTPHAVAYTMQDRAGKPGGGKGFLIQKDRATSLRTGNYQYVFQPVEGVVLDDQGGRQISGREDGKSPTLRAEMHGNVPCVMGAVGFDAYNQSATGAVAKPLTAAASDADHVPCVVYDARGNGDGAKASTITGDHENRITDYTSVVCVPIHDQATRFSGKRGDKSDGKGNGLGVGEPGDPMNTLTAGDRHSVAYSLETFHCVAEEEKTTTLKARDYKDPTVVCYSEAEPIAIDRAFFNQGQNALYDPQYYEDGTVPTLVARGPSAVAHYWDGGQTCGTLTANNAGGNQRMPDKENFNCVIAEMPEQRRNRYIVRRLTPTECARLQGFADRWGDIEEKTEFSDEEYRFWLEVRNAHAAINGKAVKDYTEQQMLNWYNKLHTDSSEYKMWGNGISLPTALYCLQGIAEVLSGD